MNEPTSTPEPSPTDGWRSIAETPKDGTWIEATWDGWANKSVRYMPSREMFVDSSNLVVSEPFRWRPLPTPAAPEDTPETACETCMIELRASRRIPGMVHKSETKCMECGMKLCGEHARLHFKANGKPLPCENLQVANEAVVMLTAERNALAAQLADVTKERDTIRKVLQQMVNDPRMPEYPLCDNDGMDCPACDLARKTLMALEDITPQDIHETRPDAQ